MNDPATFLYNLKTHVVHMAIEGIARPRCKTEGLEHITIATLAARENHVWICRACNIKLNQPEVLTLEHGIICIWMEDYVFYYLIISFDPVLKCSTKEEKLRFKTFQTALLHASERLNNVE